MPVSSHENDAIWLLYLFIYFNKTPTLVGYFIQGSLKYGLFEIFKPLAYGVLGATAADADAKILVLLVSATSLE